MQLSGIYTDYSDDALDDLYASTVAAVKSTTGDALKAYQQARIALHSEIIERLTTPAKFITAIFSTPFPKFQAIEKANPFGHYSASDEARTSVAESAKAVGADIKSGAKTLLGATTVIAASAAVLALLIFFRKK